MADQDPLAREFERLRVDLRDDFAAVHIELAKLVPREVHALALAALEARQTSHERVVEKLAQAVEARWTQDDALRKADQAQRTTDRRWLISAIILPIVALVIQVMLARGGAAP